MPTVLRFTEWELIECKQKQGRNKLNMVLSCFMLSADNNAMVNNLYLEMALDQIQVNWTVKINNQLFVYKIRN